MHPITTVHPQYALFAPLWEASKTALAGEPAVKAAGERYLPKTSGMLNNPVSGIAQYTSYLQRARFYDLAAQSQSALIGLAFEKTPEANPTLPFAINGASDADFAITALREISAKGRYVAVVDVGSDGAAVVSGYVAESFVNWKTDEKGALTLAVFKEHHGVDDNEYSHTTRVLYRVYRLTGASVEISLYTEEGEALATYGEVAFPVAVPRDTLDVVIFGSIDLSADCDAVPLLPVVDCMFAAYRASADYKNALFMAAQATPWVTGVSETQWELIIKQGIGSSALWWLGDEGKAGFLETSGVGMEAMAKDIASELKQAEAHAVRLTQSDSGGVEGSESIALRAASQHATIYTLIRAITNGIRALREILESRNSTNGAETFTLFAEFTPGYASAQLLTSLNNSVAVGNIPATVLYTALRKMKLTEKTDEELQDELVTLSPLAPIGEGSDGK